MAKEVCQILIKKYCYKEKVKFYKQLMNIEIISLFQYSNWLNDFTQIRNNFKWTGNSNPKTKNYHKKKQRLQLGQKI